MNHPIHVQDRQISSSSDQCRCEACRNQEELKNYQRQNPTNIYMYKHLKKRGVPPVKKELLNKQLSRKPKDNYKRDDMERKPQQEKTPATPIKHKLIQALRAKDTPASSFFTDYHPVSHSQREKLPSKQALSGPNEQPRRIVNLQELRSGAFNKDNKLRFGMTKLVEISQNPENIRLRCHNSRSVSQASASHNENTNEGTTKSLEKIKQ